MNPSLLDQKYSPRTTKNVNLLERIFGNLHGIPRVCTHPVGNIKTDDCLNGQQISYPVLPDKSHSTIPWNSCDYLLQLNFKIAHIAGSVNTAADFISRLEMKVTEKIHLKIRKDVQTTPIEVSTSSSDVADEEQFFFTQSDGQNESEEQILQRKQQAQKKAAEWVLHQEQSSMTPSIKEFTKADGNTTSFSINGNKASARIRVEQDADLVLTNLNFKIIGQPHDDVHLSTDRRSKHYEANEDRIILKDGLLFKKHYGETGSVKYYQFLIPKQLVNEVLRNLHGEFGKHPGVTKTIIAYREKFYYPNMARIIR